MAGVPFPTTYDPPHAWDEGLAELRDRPQSPYYGKVAFHHVTDPVPGDAVIRQEIDRLLALKPERTGEVLTAIMAEEIQFEPTFAALLQLGAHTPKSMELLHSVSEVAKYWILRHKQARNRARPVQLEPALAPPFFPAHPAYPSGHAGQSHAVALALIDATPASWHRRLRDTARAIGHRREIAGVHYPSDSAAGIRLAEALVVALRNDPGGVYRRQVEEARKELGAPG